MKIEESECTFSKEDFINGYVRGCTEIREFIYKNFCPTETIQKILREIEEMIYWSED